MCEPMQYLLIGESHQITWGLGRIRTDAMPLDRRKPPDHLGTRSSLNRSCLLVGLQALESLGGLVEPEPMSCHLAGVMPRVFWGPGRLAPSLRLRGAWLRLTMVTPSDQLSRAFLLQKVVAIAFASIAFLEELLFYLVALFKPTVFCTGTNNQIGGTRSIFRPEIICPV